MRFPIFALLAAATLGDQAFAQNTENVVLIRDEATDVGVAQVSTRRVVWVDYDFDGDLDLFTLNFGSPNQVFANQGAGVLVEDTAPGNDLLGTSDALGVAFADLDGDGDADVVIANGSNLANSVLLNLSAAPDLQPGRFVTVVGAGIEAELKQSFGAALGDLNGDGNADLVVANRYTSNDLYWGQGDGTFVLETSTPIDNFSFASRDVEFADIDGDGDLDVLVANSTSAHNLYFVNLGGEQGGVEGTFGGRSFDTPGATTGKSFGLALADLDGDGLLDVVMANRTEPNAVHRNTFTGSGAPKFQRVLGSVLDLDVDDSYDVALGDLEGDGDVDMVFANRLQDNALYLATQADPLSTPATGYVRVLKGDIVSDRGNSRSVALADLYAYPDPLTGQPISGALELAVGNTAGGANFLYRSYGAEWEPLGGGLGGGLGVPALTGQGHTAAAETITLNLGNAPAGAPAALLLSVAATAIPFKGGTLLADVTPGLGVLQFLGSTDGLGQLALPIGLPAVLPPGIDPGLAFYAQMLVADVSAPVDVGITNGLRLRVSN